MAGAEARVDLIGFTGTTEVVPCYNTPSNGFSPQPVKPIDFSRLMYGLKRLRRNSEIGVELTELRWQGLKPVLIRLALSARLKSCPVTLPPPVEFFRSL